MAAFRTISCFSSSIAAKKESIDPTKVAALHYQKEKGSSFLIQRPKSHKFGRGKELTEILGIFKYYISRFLSLCLTEITDVFLNNIDPFLPPPHVNWEQ